MLYTKEKLEQNFYVLNRITSISSSALASQRGDNLIKDIIKSYLIKGVIIL